MIRLVSVDKWYMVGVAVLKKKKKKKRYVAEKDKRFKLALAAFCLPPFWLHHIGVYMPWGHELFLNLALYL